ncbi:MAG: bifunctional (p)ppGpp synthetase/guanosine-3',5'-bis(diphosphate) 3'-pyrophosphohydrolase [Calditrichaeota bacterium]|nr:bifunctional (p)ppGpp synthetase/guanosine-3',5'-bis(diphosphate) 3'-pyrophosphohydrolase [Calditrichota bacterium]MCB9391552.1 bifunctional (p)ppGpp synthetase/guanosine-3',5'-bis(diphosphate) 3'-pyrophosphohydrolase [Calditrichota bacterium]
MAEAARKLSDADATREELALPPLSGPQYERVEPEFVLSMERIRVALLSHLPQADFGLVERAFHFAYDAHKNQRRLSGEPYITHLLSVAEILADLHMREDVIAAGLLHDVVEDTETTMEQLRGAFGDGVAKMVDGVTKIPELKYESKEKQQAENLHKMLLSMVNDLRVILIKFADRLHNMRTIGHMNRKQQERIALETMDVYAPLAHRLGVYQIKWELEDIAFKVLNPRGYHELAEKVTLKRTERERIIQRETTRIQTELRKAGIKGQVVGRPKHLYSIYNKIKTRGYSFEEILDLLAIRIIVPKLEECYYALGIVHSLYTPIQDKFTDFIATPKSNMYQSLHTKVFGSDGRKIEIQIRTEDMHGRAEYGIAAHWRYKEGDQSRKELDRQIEWLRSLLDNQSEAGDSREYLEDLKINLFEGEIFVFTPRGKLLTLPVGSTPVDFAFAVHTDVGLHAMAVKINAQIATLKTRLGSGDVVEIIVSPNQRPNPDWLQFVKTSRARNKIKKWLKEQHFEESERLGREMLTRELTRLRNKRTDKEITEVAQLFGHNALDSFFAALGSGDLTLENVIKKLTPEPVPTSPVANVLSKVIRRVKGDDTGIRIQGMGQVAISFGTCCQPLPGDQITGFISVGKGVVVHRVDCKNVPFLMRHPERNIKVEWDADREAKFNVRVRIMAEDRAQLLGDLTVSLAKEDVNIMYIEMKREDMFAVGRFVLEVKSLLHLQRVLKRMRAIPGVIHVERLDEEIPSGMHPM